MTDQPGQPDQPRVERADGADCWVLRLSGMDQSHVDLGDPTHLAFDYVRRIGDLLDAVGAPGQPLRVVHVGGAAMTLPRYVAATRPGSRQIVLEPDRAVVELVRAELPLPRRSGISVREVDGRTGLAEARGDLADVVVVDAFADARVPADLLTTSTFAEIDRVLVAGGVLVLNLTDRAPFAATRDVVAGLREVFAELAVGIEPPTLRGRRPGNLLLAAGDPDVVARAVRPWSESPPAAYRLVSGIGVTSGFGGGVAHS